MKQTKLTEKEYKKVVEDTSNTLRGLYQEHNRHPTQFLCDVIQANYGHKIKLSELIKLIETSELPR